MLERFVCEKLKVADKKFRACNPLVLIIIKLYKQELKCSWPWSLFQLNCFLGVGLSRDFLLCPEYNSFGDIQGLGYLSFTVQCTICIYRGQIEPDLLSILLYIYRGHIEPDLLFILLYIYRGHIEPDLLSILLYIYRGDIKPDLLSILLYSIHIQKRYWTWPIIHPTVHIQEILNLTTVHIQRGY